MDQTVYSSRVSKIRIDESDMFSSHSNKLQVYNGGIPMTGMDNPKVVKFGEVVVEHTL